MPLKRKVKDRMIPIENYSTIGPDATLKEAALSLRTSYCELETGMCTEIGPRTVMVVDDTGKLVGILDFNSFLVTLIPEIAGGLSAKLEALGVSIAFAQADAASLDEASQGFRARVIKNAGTKVRDIMMKIKGTIDAGDSLLNGLKKMFRNKITVLPVYEDDKLVGVLRDTDFFLAVADILEE
ncbi:MAG: CBS domain-containing protein [Desulfobacterales bacterium]|uniref:CBS domain-containing protein n=1 Tax=Candidatus Desulfatibia vada TaxID=2841696 RepID=A0A8J6P0Y1_9BACT|nr:CBS domain-containing protein [Candidatus Desulfatibia vada]